MPYYDDPLVRYDSPFVFYDDPGLGHPPALSPPNLNRPASGSSSMEYWEHTKERAIATLAVWEAHIPTFKVNGLLPDRKSVV